MFQFEGGDIVNFVIEIVNFNVYYGQNYVIKDVDFKILNKGVFVFMGLSGCGKSMMLRIFNRLIELNEDVRVEGEVRFFGENIYLEDVDLIEVRKKVGMVFQYLNFFFYLIIYDNVVIGFKLNGFVKLREEFDERVEWVLKKVVLWDEVKDRLNDYFGNFFGGQRQRFVIVRVFVMKLEVFLMDEFIVNIDFVGIVKIEEFFLEFKEDYMIVFVIYFLVQVVRVVDYVVFFYFGELIEVGLVRKVFENLEYELIEKYVMGVFG